MTTPTNAFYGLDTGQAQSPGTRNLHDSHPSLIIPLITIATIPYDPWLPSAIIHCITWL